MLPGDRSGCCFGEQLQQFSRALERPVTVADAALESNYSGKMPSCVEETTVADAALESNYSMSRLERCVATTVADAALESNYSATCARSV